MNRGLSPAEVFNIHQQHEQREGTSGDFVTMDVNMNIIPDNEQQIEDAVKSGKMRSGKLLRVHKSDLKDFGMQDDRR